MLRLDDLRLFVRSAELGGLSAAARELDCSPAVASAALKRLEQALQVRLLARSTRSLRLTPAGERFLPAARQALAGLDEGCRQLSDAAQEVEGVLQLTAPSDFGRNVLLPWLDALQARHPRLSVRLLLGDRQSDLFRQPADFAVRYGTPEDSSLIALPLAPSNRRVLCASPAYLQQHGAPQQPEALRDHNCLLYQLGGRVHDHWSFSQGRRSQRIAVTGNRVCDDADVVRRWALAGHGLVYKSWLDVAADVRAGRLLVLLTDWQGEATPLHLICLHREQMGKAGQLLREALHQGCAQLLAEVPWRAGNGA
jgi:DNA-binding transcriptional LysR family regulator